jgi:hypothetical protein
VVSVGQRLFPLGSTPLLFSLRPCPSALVVAVPGPWERELEYPDDKLDAWLEDRAILAITLAIEKLNIKFNDVCKWVELTVPGQRQLLVSFRPIKNCF